MEGGITTAVSLGWLWFDDDPKTSLAQKMDLAAVRFRQKFGALPRLCYVNPGMVNEHSLVGAVQLRCATNVMPGHFLFVVQEGEVATND